MDVYPPSPLSTHFSSTRSAPPLRVGVLLGSDQNSLRAARRNCAAIVHDLSECRLAALAHLGAEEEEEGDGGINHDGEEGVASRIDVRKFVEEYACKVSEDLMVFELEKSFDKLLVSDEVDAVYLPLSTGHHKEWALKALRHGKHVLVEHPAALYVSDYAKMLAEANRRRKYLAESTDFLHCHRTDEFLKIVKDKARMGFVDRVNCDLILPLARRGGFWHEQSYTVVHAASGFAQHGGSEKGSSNPLGCIDTLGWYCVRMAVAVFSALGNGGRAIDARIIHVRRDHEMGIPVDATCLVRFEDDRILSFHCRYGHSLCQRVEACGSVRSASMADFVWPKRRSSMMGFDGQFLPHIHGEEEDCEDNVAVVQQFDGAISVMNGSCGSPKQKALPPPQETLMWRTFAMVARALDESAERAGQAARAAAIAEVKGKSWTEEEENGEERGDEFDPNDENYDEIIRTAKGGWAGRHVLMEEAERMSDLSLRTQEVMDALRESAMNGCMVAKIV